jgi:hypothetical protein
MMFPHMNEDVANQRLTELEHELDAAGLLAVSGPNLVDLARRLLVWMWFIAGTAARRSPRPASLTTQDDEGGDEAATAPDAA